MNNKIIDENVDSFLCPDTGEELIYVRKDDRNSSFINKFETKFPAKMGFVDFVGTTSSVSRVTAKSPPKDQSFADTYEAFLSQDQWYNKLLNKIMWGQELEPRLFQSVIKVFLTQMQEGTILDIPVATGMISAPLYFDFPKMKFFAVDYSITMLQKAFQSLQRRGVDNAILVQANPAKLPFKPEIFDGITSMNGLNFWKDYKAALAEMFRVAKPGAKIIGTCYCKGVKKISDKLVEKLLVEKEHFRSVFVREDLNKALAEVGFKNVAVGKFNEYPMFQFNAEKPK